MFDQEAGGKRFVGLFGNFRVFARFEALKGAWKAFPTFWDTKDVINKYKTVFTL